jgi:oxygen-dependent protoporphyrinogen oxidase
LSALQSAGAGEEFAARHEVVIVGGGAAGLSAAWRLRDRDVLLIEREPRLGGRAKSLPRGDHWLNFGAHLFPGVGSAIHELVTGLGLAGELINVPGSKAGLFFKGKAFTPRRSEALPFLLPLTVRERVALASAGLKLRAGVAAWHRSQGARAGEPDSARFTRMSAFESERTFAEFLGPLPASVDAIFRSAARRSAGEPDELSAGAGLSLFGTIWVGKGSDSAGNTWRNVRGGSGRMGEAALQLLGDAAALEATVLRIEDRGEDAVVTVRRNDAEERILARHVVVATPAPVARALVTGLPADVDQSLGSISYGPFVSMAALTGGEGPMPWDSTYALATPSMEFNMLFNHANPVTAAAARPAGGSFMVYAAGQPARRLLELDSEQISQRFLADLYRIYPSLRGLVEETIVQKWPIGNTYRTPSTRFAPMWDYSQRPRSVLRFAGDYFDPLAGSMDAAARSGFAAADAVLAELDAAASAPVAR